MMMTRADKLTLKTFFSAKECWLNEWLFAGPTPSHPVSTSCFFVWEGLDEVERYKFDIIVWLSKYYCLIIINIYHYPRLQEEGQNLADSLQSPFIEVYNDDDDFNNQIIIAVIMQLIIDFFRGSFCSLLCFCGISLNGMFHSFLVSENDYIIKS